LLVNRLFCLTAAVIVSAWAGARASALVSASAESTESAAAEQQDEDNPAAVTVVSKHCSFLLD
jgi:hypothetical protein